ncbi:M24 family peptidase, partial [gut metagenome]
MTSPIEPKGFLLFDVCGHYLCGTTDLTRTVAVGALTAEMKRDYTIALKAHMTLARQKFPVGTTGNLLDAIVKANHWNHAMNFGHGTGHGIGYLLNVHEGPAKIITEYAPLFPYARETALKPGMLFSNEPGVYKPGRHGIRLENSVFVIEDQKTEFGQFLGFETITFFA